MTKSEITLKVWRFFLDRTVNQLPVQLQAGCTGYADEPYELPATGWYRALLTGDRPAIAAKVKFTDLRKLDRLRDAGMDESKATTEETLVIFKRYTNADIWICQIGRRFMCVLGEEGTENRTEAVMGIIDGKKVASLPNQNFSTQDEELVKLFKDPEDIWLNSHFSFNFLEVL